MSYSSTDDDAPGSEGTGSRQEHDADPGGGINSPGNEPDTDSATEQQDPDAGRLDPDELKTPANLPPG